MVVGGVFVHFSKHLGDVTFMLSLNLDDICGVEVSRVFISCIKDEVLVERVGIDWEHVNDRLILASSVCWRFQRCFLFLSVPKVRANELAWDWD